MLADEYPEADHHAPAHYGGTPVKLHLEVVDVDHTYRAAVDAGAVSEREPEDQGHGNRNALIKDPFGHRWVLSQSIDAARTEAAAQAGDGDTGTFTVSGRPPNELGYVTMRTADLERARAFFGALFSWQVEPGNLEGGGHVANTRLPMGFMQSDDTEGSPVSLYVRVDDIDAFATRVEELGGQVLSRNDYPSGGNAECVDDQGFRFELFRPAPGY
jgi:predicted enzyme related to lactoylglutathione lyase